MNDEKKAVKSQAVKFIVIMGLVSLFADVTYEGARSITGPYLALLGASAAVVGFVSGLGEFLGYGLRLVSGYLADRTERYWLVTALGYAVNLLAVPALALAGRWEVAAGLLILERAGKGIRTPARDAMLSYATSQVGRGFGFAVHEALDQIGAVGGPLLVAAALYLAKDYRIGFAVLILPAILALGTLARARLVFPDPRVMERYHEKELSPAPQLPPVFWLYIAFSVTAVMGYPHFQLLSFHFKEQSVLPDAYIPLLYAFAMGIDGGVAFLAGWCYDRAGLRSLFVFPLLAIFLPWLAFSSSHWPAVAGMIIWGALMGLQEATMRAAVADMTPPRQRGLAYGIFNTAYGAAWFAGSAALGFLYDRLPGYIAPFVTALQLLAAALLLFTLKLAKKS
ncbi:MFS transporter [Desulfovirgula thermocuniculi]|uniref:MFS transporter n=1 Tax=Desulfovirgula thermocuniculi TaxID=348842 RepID=UPI0003F83722|nr:MFS transporter [Desulfovirgula thermocuniculi]